jgi:hypothetical protein
MKGCVDAQDSLMITLALSFFFFSLSKKRKQKDTQGSLGSLMAATRLNAAMLISK